jgi:RNA polymerase sigma-70 factor (ECF subfamily)
MADGAPRTARSDAELVAAMARGDERAATTFYDRHSPTVMALAFRMLRERADADSIVLETFMQAWRDASRFDGSRGSAASWLLTIARTRALDFLRTSGRQAKRIAGTVDELPAESLPASDRAGSPGFDVEQDERQRAVASALGTLPDNQRIPIELAFYEGLSHSEVAERLAEPLGTVKTRIRLGMTKLRDALRPFAEEAVS